MHNESHFLFFFSSYLIIMIVIGALSSRKLKNVEDFLIAGRRLNLPLTAATLMATWTGAAAMTGYTGWIYEGGYSMIWIALATTTSLFFIALFFSEKLQSLAVLTIPDILKRYYDGKTQKVGAVFISTYCIGIVSGELLGGAYVMSAVLGWDFHQTILVSAATIIGYCLLGGLWAVAITDLFQFILLAGGLAIAVPSVLFKMGGWSLLHREMELLDPAHLDICGYVSLDLILAWFIIIFASNFIAPDIHQRMYAARSGRTARLAMGITGLWDVMLTLGALILGSAAFVHFQGTLEPDLALPQLFVDFFPGMGGMILMVTLMAVIMSTADSLLLVAGGTLSHDLFMLDSRSGVRYLRFFTLLAGVISVIFCFYFESIMDAILFSSSIYAAGVFIPVISCLLGKRGTPDAAFFSCIGGGGTAIAWRILQWDYDPVLPGICVCLFLFSLISFLQRPQTGG
ncbi:MAG: sodium:solute symporter family protein [Theionarchaea archaeon]|nr:sodium:solute symporter family protein [Theionarchaea archaeon]